jgi:RNA recognition motif-containing protein
MPNEAEADAAIDALDESSVNGRTIAVKKADDRGKTGDRPERGPRQDRPRDDNRPSNDFKRPDERISRPIIAPEDVLPLKPERKKEKEVFPKKALVKPDAPKKPKMEAYKKSGKNNRFFDEDDEEDLDWELNNRRNSSGWDDDDEEE